MYNEDLKETDVLVLAQEIIDGRRLGRADDLHFFVECSLEDLCLGADRLREHFTGDKVDLLCPVRASSHKLRGLRFSPGGGDPGGVQAE